MKTLTPLFWSQFLVLAFAGLATAAPSLFDDNSVLDVEFRGPLSSTIRDKRDPDERAFTIVVDGVETPVEVRTRGKSRLQLCRFPPLRLNFGKHAGEENLFTGLDKLKLVTHCANRPANEDNLLEEYVAYRLFNLLTDRSHRVRLMRVRYVDSDKPKREPEVHYAFAIEPVEQVAKRTGAQVSPSEYLVKSKINREQIALIFVFQYLIANMDWSLVPSEGESYCCHNAKLLKVDEQEILLPYDFDLSGFVYANYARRSDKVAVPISRKRRYNGYCFDNLPLEEAIGKIQARQSEIMTIIDDIDWAEPKQVTARRDFIRSFFDEAEKGGLARDLTRSCPDG